MASSVNNSNLTVYLMVCNDAISVFLKYLIKQYVILSTKKHIKPIEKMYMMTFLSFILSPKPFMIECNC